MRSFRSIGFTSGIVLLTSLLVVAGAISVADAERSANASTSVANEAAVPYGDDLQSRTRTSVTGIGVAADYSSVISAPCPQGRVALGGGVGMNSAERLYLVTSGPRVNGSRLKTLADGLYGAPDGWFGGVFNNETSAARTYKVAAICTPLSGLTTTVTSVDVNPSSSWSLQASCPAGMVAVGGGVDVENADFMVVTSSTPTIGGVRMTDLADGTHGEPDGWSGSVRNNAGSLQEMFVAVVCQRLKGVKTVVASMLVTNGTTATRNVYCADGFMAVGGGLDSSDSYGVIAMQTSPVFSPPDTQLIQRNAGVHPAPIAWRASMRNISGSNKTMKIGAVCAQWPMNFFEGEDARPDR